MNTKGSFAVRLALLLAMLCGSATSFADALTLGNNLGNGNYGFNNTVAPGNFSDSWAFTLASNSDVQIDITDLPFTLQPLNISIFNIDNSLNATLNAGSGTSFAVLGLLANTTYQLVVSGLADGGSGGLYAGALTVTAVPLPPAAILFGSVLFGFAVIARKRNLGASVAAA